MLLFQMKMECHLKLLGLASKMGTHHHLRQYVVQFIVTDCDSTCTDPEALVRFSVYIFFCIFCTSSGIKLLGFGSLTTSLGYYPWSNLQNMINFVDPSNKYILIYLIKQETLQTEDRKVRNTLPITQISRVGQGCIFLRS